MILGIGTDIVSVARITRVLQKKYAHRFIDRVFTPAEQEYCEKQVGGRYERYAARWAIKEALYKALPESCQSGATWRSVECVRSTGKGGVHICSQELSAQLSEYGDLQVHHSISHDGGVAVAFVILEVSP
ncbi:holo-ACP synthase [Chitinivibrio alkaliphilus]|uniref:Holo-[acyl-carrier-protein] synthase n=1 Tax=Chitinivibrio alkaliphilus ACht1 TaxID=1313304 RepID=U7DCA2_9BACT|nr:holo-ACP synthase [Chitinivibrio alkaliphilus]ERP32050.1 holo-acyl-carrier-protein synthase [Chitinivibrio alkaliphilus ACht1]